MLRHPEMPYVSFTPFGINGRAPGRMIRAVTSP
jgi:hypothetical protein